VGFAELDGFAEADIALAAGRGPASAFEGVEAVEDIAEAQFEKDGMYVGGGPRKGESENEEQPSLDLYSRAVGGRLKKGITTAPSATNIIETSVEDAVALFECLILIQSPFIPEAHKGSAGAENGNYFRRGKGMPAK
jgi:hypothetical protein